MIDYANTFDQRQSIRVRKISLRADRRVRHLVGMVAVGAVVVGMVAGVSFSLLIRSGLRELAAMQETRLELVREQQALTAARREVMARERIVKAAAAIGLYEPAKGQVRRL